MNEEQKNLIGRCGLYCGACVIYRYERDSQELRKKLADKWKCEVSKVKCEGCQALTPDSWGYDCKFIKCQEEKGYKFCFECEEYQNESCKMFSEFSKSYLEEDGVDLKKNLNLIKERRVDEWLEESLKKYTCPYCGKPLVAGRKECHHCGKEVNLKSEHNK